MIIENSLFERGRSIFENSLHEWQAADTLDTAAMLRYHSEGARCLVIGTKRYPDEFYQSLEQGTLILRYGVGSDKIPLDPCRDRNLFVANTPGTLDQSVAEHAIALMMALARNVSRGHKAVTGGEWPKITGTELHGATLAILGFGKIGSTVARIARAGFGMRIHAFDIQPQPHPSVAHIPDLYSTEYTAAVNGADFVSLHMALQESTRGFLGRERLAELPPGSFLISTARGGLISEPDLFDALSQKQLAGAALDVFETEPYIPQENRDLRTLPNVVMTPHLGSNTRQANLRIARSCIAAIDAFEENRTADIPLVPELH